MAGEVVPLVRDHAEMRLLMPDGTLYALHTTPEMLRKAPRLTLRAMAETIVASALEDLKAAG